MVNSLLIEFLTEELPPIGLEKNIGYAFANSLFEQLKVFLSSNSSLQFFVTPRRFGCVITQVLEVQPDRKFSRKGPAIVAGLTNGLPNPALLGFIKACSLDNYKKLEQRADGYFYFSGITPGLSLEAALPEIINTSLKNIKIAKLMRWANFNFQFVRPVHNLVILYGEKIICKDTAIMGLIPNNLTYGHRFMAPDALTIQSADGYLQQMVKEGKVIAEFAIRRELIAEQLAVKSQQLNLHLNESKELLDEVAALVEFPEVLIGEFDEKFLQVPQECLVLTMAKNQKYFALLDSQGKLSNKFLFVANILSNTPQVMINGNQKVLSARLADAEFFYNLDKKHSLNSYISRLTNVIYHNKLGTQLERITRLQAIVASIADRLNINSVEAAEVALLIKADLSTEMVGEFPELQGVMGRYYALHDGYNNEIATAIEQHYYPRFSGDRLPESKLGKALALTDKLETLVGIWGIGLIPTGDKDPYALRRAALGVIRILMETELNLAELINITIEQFTPLSLTPTTASELYEFILQRLANYLASVYQIDTKFINAIIKTKPTKFNHLSKLLADLQAFATKEVSQSLLQANKRIENILAKNNNLSTCEPIKTELLIEAEEKILYDLITNLEIAEIKQALNLKDWNNYFALFGKLSQPLDNFFDKVMVMTDDLKIRNNRLNLLNKVYYNFNLPCKLSELI